MDLEEIKLRQLSGQFLLTPAGTEEAARGLLGIQAQFFRHAMHALCLRSRDFSPALVQETLIKTWTLRGTVHLVPLEDLPLHLNGDTYRKNEWSSPSFWNQRSDWALTPARQEALSAFLLQTLAAGPLPRDELKARCRTWGMTPEEEKSMFHPWGGGIRELCERGFLHYRAQEEKVLCLSPEVTPLPRDQAMQALAARYFAHYGPATVHDAMYFFHTSARQVRAWLDMLPVRESRIGGTCYYDLCVQASPNSELPVCLFLGGFDPLLLGYEKKESLYLRPEHLRSVFSLSGIVRPTCLLRGQIVGVWKKEGKKLLLSPFHPIDPTDRRLIRDAAAQQLPWLREIAFEP